MITPRNKHLAGERPRASSWVVDFRAPLRRSKPQVCSRTRHKHFAVRQQSGGVKAARNVHASSFGPGACRRIVKLGSGKKVIVGASVSTRNQHLAVGQKRRRTILPRGGESAGKGPGSSDWVVEFCALRWI